MRPQPLTNNQIDAIRDQLANPNTSPESVLDAARQLLEDRDHWYTKADYWRESYRLAKGYTFEEINAREAIADATVVHPRPCWFPHEACVCDSEPDSR